MKTTVKDLLKRFEGANPEAEVRVMDPFGRLLVVADVEPGWIVDPVSEDEEQDFVTEKPKIGFFHPGALILVDDEE